MMTRRPKVIICLLFTLFFLVWLGLDSEVFARAGGGRSSGSSRGFSSGGSSPRGPSPASPSQREYQQPRPQAQPTAPASGMGRNFLTGLAGGMVGGLLGGMLFRSLGFAGGGMGTGEGGFGFGDIFLLLVILGIIYFVVKRFRARQTMQMSTAGAGTLPYSFPGPTPGPIFTPPPAEEHTGGTVSEGLSHIKSMDASFEEKKFKDLAGDIFFKIQGSWTRRDLSAVRNLLTPQMFDILKKDLDDLLSRKQINRLENIAVREVEIVDAGQERGEDTLTVRLYANLLDYVVDEKSGQVLSGSSSEPVKFVEFWTFTRNVGEKNWALAGITQEGGR
jgi:predicted lipid-binding transport protein (Tim44 family)